MFIYFPHFFGNKYKEKTAFNHFFLYISCLHGREPKSGTPPRGCRCCNSRHADFFQTEESNPQNPRKQII